MAAATLFKALVHCRWRNRITRQVFNVRAGQVVTFDAGDFNEPGGPVTAALTSLQDVLDRGVFALWDPAHAGDPEYMSRDELAELVRAFGLREDVPHDASIDELRPLVAAHLEGLAKGAEAPLAAHPRRARATAEEV